MTSSSKARGTSGFAARRGNEQFSRFICPKPVIEARRKALADALIRKRDQYIADRIEQTLQIGETGILFLGMLHALENQLHKDIRVIYPVKLALYHGK
jgi:hypothetical protein